MINAETYTPPAVGISMAPSASPEVLSHILWGMEEEGIPADVVEAQEGATLARAYAMALKSSLDVGIGLCAKLVVLHHRDLPEEKPLIIINADVFSGKRLRRLGTNAARLVKGDPLVFDHLVKIFEHCDPAHALRITKSQR